MTECVPVYLNEIKPKEQISILIIEEGLYSKGQGLNLTTLGFAPCIPKNLNITNCITFTVNLISQAFIFTPF